MVRGPAQSQKVLRIERSQHSLLRYVGCISEGQELPPIPPEFEQFTPRTARTLVRGGYRSLSHVQAASDAELLALRNFGIRSLAEVRVMDR